MNPPTPAAGYTEEGSKKIAEDEAARLQSMMEAFNSGFYNNAPTVDPFSGQQVSAQDQAAFTQPQPEIFPTSNNIANTLNVGSSDPLTNILGSQVGNLSYSEMNALRNKLEESYSSTGSQERGVVFSSASFLILTIAPGCFNINGLYPC
jgi:hypothetical protein